MGSTLGRAARPAKHAQQLHRLPPHSPSNGEVPFGELNAFPVPHFRPIGRMCQLVPWRDALPHSLFLRQRSPDALGIEATDAPYLPAIETIQQALLDINTLSLGNPQAHRQPARPVLRNGSSPITFPTSRSA